MAPSAAHVVRAVLEGVAQRGADLVEAAEVDSDAPPRGLRIDGGMSANPVFVQALADATQRPVEVVPRARGDDAGRRLPGRARHRACGARGTRSPATWSPRQRVEPGAATDRDRWRDAVDRSREWFADLSTLDF